MDLPARMLSKGLVWAYVAYLTARREIRIAREIATVIITPPEQPGLCACGFPFDDHEGAECPVEIDFELWEEDEEDDGGEDEVEVEPKE